MTSKASPEDLAFGEPYELVAGLALAKRLWGADVRVEKRGKFAQIDLNVLGPDGAIVGLIEVKARRVASDAYDTTIVSSTKRVSARTLQEAMSTPGKLVRTAMLVIFTDRAGYLWLDGDFDGVQFIRRPDRGNVPYPHATFRHERFMWPEGLLEEINRGMEAQKGA